MYSDISRDSEYINRLTIFISEEYNIHTVAIKPAKRGYYGETWRLNATDRSYFIKLVYLAIRMAVYQRSFPVIQYLCEQGIDFISKIVKTKYSDLFSIFDGAVLGVFNWIDGENIETDDTKIPEYQMLAKEYSVPIHGVKVSYEDFSGKSVDKFFEQWSLLDDSNLLQLLEKNRKKLIIEPQG